MAAMLLLQRLQAAGVALASPSSRYGSMWLDSDVGERALTGLCA